MSDLLTPYDVLSIERAVFIAACLVIAGLSFGYLLGRRSGRDTAYAEGQRDAAREALAAVKKPRPAGWVPHRRLRLTDGRRRHGWGDQDLVIYGAREMDAGMAALTEQTRLERAYEGAEA